MPEPDHFRGQVAVGFGGMTQRICSRAGPLTRREQQVANLVAAGSTNKQIATELDISRRNVEVHVDHILRKLNLVSRVQIAAWMTEHG